jgi:hypothetical protein
MSIIFEDMTARHLTSPAITSHSHYIKFIHYKTILCYMTKRMKTERICIRIPKKMLKKLDETEDDENRSHKIREAIKEYVNKQIDLLLKKY